MNYFCVLSDKSDALRLDKNNVAALNNERVTVQIDFILLSALLT